VNHLVDGLKLDVRVRERRNADVTEAADLATGRKRREHQGRRNEQRCSHGSL
jgi:hypothetical protein